MMKVTIKIDKAFDLKMKNINKEIGAVVGTMVETEFVDMLHDTPQYTGNFAANMAVQVGGSMGRKGGDFPLPQKIKRQQAFERGAMPAIAIARSRNAGTKARIQAGFVRASGLWPSVTIYNRHPEAVMLEKLTAGSLRFPNKPGAHPIARMERNLKARFAQRLVYGSSQWKYLVSTEIM